jgi:hypothetical protein
MNYQKLYEIAWTQIYESWPRPSEEEILDLTEARAVLARIMSL